MMAEIIYILCTIASGVCSFLLLRGYKRSKVKILLWSGLCFCGIAINNAIVIVDLVLTSAEVDLSTYRAIIFAGAVFIQIYGFVWENR